LGRQVTCPNYSPIRPFFCLSRNATNARHKTPRNAISEVGCACFFLSATWSPPYTNEAKTHTDFLSHMHFTQVPMSHVPEGKFLVRRCHNSTPTTNAALPFLYRCAATARLTCLWHMSLVA
jgi:hypothetical protein